MQDENENFVVTDRQVKKRLGNLDLSAKNISYQVYKLEKELDDASLAYDNREFEHIPTKIGNAYARLSILCCQLGINPEKCFSEAWQDLQNTNRLVVTKKKPQIAEHSVISFLSPAEFFEQWTYMNSNFILVTNTTDTSEIGRYDCSAFWRGFYVLPRFVNNFSTYDSIHHAFRLNHYLFRIKVKFLNGKKPFSLIKNSEIEQALINEANIYFPPAKYIGKTPAEKLADLYDDQELTLQRLVNYMNDMWPIYKRAKREIQNSELAGQTTHLHTFLGFKWESEIVKPVKTVEKANERMDQFGRLLNDINNGKWQQSQTVIRPSQFFDIELRDALASTDF
ncbi:hypothetical protein [uncultured Limosilactobacillus sp.]|uniref:hypothetical protein n=1 Tax=uncultured Limosilactobacillus sp. TaxID=2837629 RepID=UPI0025D3CDFA|nr:hypothetical protein [uncultured Limosilactobacillus sp.]